MKLLEQIKKDRITARKERDTVKATLLTTLVGEADNILKSKQRKGFTTLALIKKFLKGIAEVEKAGVGLTLDQDRERRILESYIPKQYNFIELERIINTIDLERPMGQVMGYLKDNHGDKVDMKMASQIIKGKQQ